MSFHRRKAVLSIFKNKLKNINLNFTVLMAYRTPRITGFHEFRQKLSTLETLIWLLRPKERLYCKHHFHLHSCLSIHPKCGCQENPFSSQCCMSGVPLKEKCHAFNFECQSIPHLDALNYARSKYYAWTKEKSPCLEEIKHTLVIAYEQSFRN